VGAWRAHEQLGGTDGRHGFEGLNDGVAHTIVRLSKNLNPRNYDSSGIGPGNDLVGEVYDFCESDSEEGNEGEDILTSLKINSLSLHFFRSQLVTHFSILFERNQIVWPKSKHR
jgi:hypothetical protein